MVGHENEGGLALCSTGETALVLGTTDEHVRRLIRTGRLRAHKLGTGPKARFRIESAEIARFLQDTAAPRPETR